MGISNQEISRSNLKNPELQKPLEKINFAQLKEKLNAVKETK